VFNPFKKKLKPEQVKMFLVPIEDLELLKVIRINMAHGNTFTIFPPVSSNVEAFKNNAQILKESYGLTETEVLVETGFWLGEKENVKGDKY
jgi:hypothetical protein